jgi:hypothetical protein
MLTTALLAMTLWPSTGPACCPAPPSGKPVVNADQSVIIIWDSAAKIQHFVRQASFKSEAADFGFIVPTPSQPELAESGDEAFPFLLKLTEPERQKVPRPSGGMGCGCGSAPPPKMSAGAPKKVEVLEQKVVAGFDAVVLQAESADALVGWLKDHGYSFSPEVEAWARPYVGAGWKFTALKVAKPADGTQAQTVATSALRLSFKTDRPVFPYREPDSQRFASALNAKSRLLRIYFLAEARYQGAFSQDRPWKSTVAWANPLNEESRQRLLRLLKLPADAGTTEWWLTEFEHYWPYEVAPGDVYFARATNQSMIKRPPIVEYVTSPWPADVTAYALAAVVVLSPLVRRVRRRREN